MADPVKLIWTSARDLHTGKVNLNEGMAYDGKVPVGQVSLAAGDPQNRGAWRWSMFGYGRHCREGRASLQRSGAATTKQEAKAACERAYRKLLAAGPGNREDIHDHHAAAREMDRAYTSDEGLRHGLEGERRSPDQRKIPDQRDPANGDFDENYPEHGHPPWMKGWSGRLG